LRDQLEGCREVCLDEAITRLEAAAVRPQNILAATDLPNRSALPFNNVGVGSA
jgi:hypothetical protein